jgi:hypothetical protein
MSEDPVRGMRLTEDQKRLIIAAIEAGATDYVAAEAAGISPRTLRDLRARAEGRHATRRSTPELKAFFAQLDETIARARMRQEIEVAKSDPKHWLKYRARSKPGLEGWTDPVPDMAETSEVFRLPTTEELQLVVSTLIESGAAVSPPCADAACGCTRHGLRDRGGDDDG